MGCFPKFGRQDFGPLLTTNYDLNFICIGKSSLILYLMSLFSSAYCSVFLLFSFSTWFTLNEYLYCVKTAFNENVSFITLPNDWLSSEESTRTQQHVLCFMDFP